MRVRIIILCISLALSHSVIGQIPIADFSFPTGLCISEQFELENTSVNANSYEWDFCLGDFANQPTIELFNSSPDYATNNNISIYSDSKFDTLRYVFLASGGTKKVFRFKTDDNLDQVYLEELNLTGISLDRPIDLSIVEIEGNYFGYLIDFNTSKLFEINFGNSLENQPLGITDLGNFGSLNQPYSVKAVQEGGEIKIVITNFGNSNLTIVTKDGAGTFTHGNFNTGSVRGYDIDFINIDGNVYGLMSFPDIGRVRVYDFGSTITKTPSLLLEYSNAAMPSPNNSKWIIEGGNVKALVQSNNSNQVLIEFSDDLSSVTNLVIYGNYGVLNNFTRGISIHQNKQSEWHALVLLLNNDIYKVSFGNTCDSNIGLSEVLSPLVSYPQSGNYSINLTAQDAEGNLNTITKEITVTSNQAPTGDIVVDAAYCIVDNLNFTLSTTDAISTYSWDFGDGNTSTATSPTYQYGEAGEYYVSVLVESTAGCTNTLYDTLKILPEPQPVFSTTNSEYCTFESISFNNTTVFDYGSNVSWTWDFNGEGTSTAQNPDFTFTTSGTKTITLEGNVLGCVNTYQGTLNIVEGPAVDFSYDKNCLGESIQFSNLTTRINITSYLWDFGDGQSSTLESPMHSYGVAGNYNVSLTVSNNNGCQNTSTQTLQVFDQIIAGIENTEATENLPFELGIDWNNAFDSTQMIIYQWELNGQIQTTDTAKYTLGQGMYNINLSVTTANGCLFTIQSSISVQAAGQPTANFNLPASICISEQFELENTSVNANSYEWDFCLGDFANQPTIELFNSSPDYATNNNISIYSDSKFDTLRYVFLASGGTKKVFRFKTDDNLDQVYLEEELNLTGISLDRPIDLSIVEIEGNYFGYLIDFNTSKLFEINFGNSLENQPLGITDLGNFGSLNQPYSVKAVQEGGEIKIVITNFGNSNLTIVTKDGAGTFTHGNFNTGSVRGYDIDFINIDGNVYGLMSFSDIGRVRVYDFGSTITKTPSLLLEYSNAAMPSPNNSKWIIEGGNVKALVQSNNSNQVLIEFSDDLSSVTNLVIYGNYGVLNNFTRGISIHQNKQSEWHALVLLLNNDIYKVSFGNTCDSNIGLSEVLSPLVSYPQSGNYSINLTAQDAEGNLNTITKEITVTSNQAPQASFETGINLCVSNPIDFISSSDKEIASYRWNFGDGTSASDTNPSHSYPSPGEYLVSLDITDIEGCNNIYFDTVSVYAEPVPDFQSSSQGRICSRKPIDFFNTTTLPTTATFSWDFGDGTNTMEENPTHTFGSAGEYIVTLNIEMAGCTSTKVDTVQVNPGPEIAFQTTDQCYGQVIDFTNNSTGDFITAYEWDFGDGTTSTLLNPSHQFELPGEKNILLKAFTSNGCDYTFERTIEVFPLATVAFQVDPACNNSAVQFTEEVSIQNANVSSYLWDFGISGSSTDISNLANPSFTYPSAGTFEVTLSVTTEDGCVTTGSKQIVVNEIPNPTITYQANCLGEPFNFSGNANTNITNQFWQIMDSVGNVLTSSTASSFNYLFVTTGQYSISYRQQTAQLCSKTITKTIKVLEKPVAAFSFNNACAGDEVTFLNNSILNDNTASAYSWFIDGDLVSNQPNLAYQFNSAGSYEVRLQLSTATSCIAAYTDIITVTEIPTADFELTQQIGAAPFSLSTDTDINSTEMANWYINGELVSSGEAFNSTLDSVGIYLIRLEVSNESGCIQTKTRQLDIRKPILDISASRLQAVKRADYTEFILTLANKGSLVPDYYNINFSLGDYAISERLDATILPGNSVNERLSIQLSDEQLTGVARVCLEIEPIISPYEELSIVDNRVCIGISTTFSVLNIFPNPSANNVTIPLILPTASMVEIIIEQSNGQTASKQTYAELSAGYNELTLKRNGLEAGVYLLRIRYDGQEKIKKIVFY